MTDDKQVARLSSELGTASEGASSTEETQPTSQEIDHTELKNAPSSGISADRGLLTVLTIPHKEEGV